MALSIFLAKLIGLYLLIIALVLLVRRGEAEGAVQDFATSKGLLFCSGATSLLLGLAVAIGHPIYELNWRGLITLIGYLLILRGLVRTVFPSALQKKIYPFFHKRYWILCSILVILGIYLTYSGFSAV
jgi:hypothetical protein